MALIPCVECGIEVSNKAISCPKCGCPIQLDVVVSAVPAEIPDEASALNAGDFKFNSGAGNPKRRSSGVGKFLLVGAALVVAVAIGQPFISGLTSSPASTQIEHADDGKASDAAAEEQSASVNASPSEEGGSNQRDPAEAVATAPTETNEEQDPKAALLGEWCALDTDVSDNGESGDHQVLYKYVITEDAFSATKMRIGLGWAMTSCKGSMDCIDARDSTWQPEKDCPVEFSEGRFANTGTRYVSAQCGDSAALAVAIDLSSGKASMYCLVSGIKCNTF